MNSLSKEVILVIVVVIIPFTFLLRGAMIKSARRVKKMYPAFTDEEIETLTRMHNLFEGPPLYNGREWWILSVPELVDICVNVTWLAHKRGHPIKEVLKDIAGKCESLSKWMKKNASRPFYKDSDMSSLIYKPAEVGRRLRELAFKAEISKV